MCHYGSPVISSGGNRRFESDFRGASEREPRNLPQECCLAAVSSWLIVCVSQGFAQLLSEKGACVTGLPFCYINHTKHSAELATGVATPYPAAPDSLHGKASHLVLRSLCSPTNQVRLPPYSGGRINRSTLSCRVMWHNAERP